MRRRRAAGPRRAADEPARRCSPATATARPPIVAEASARREAPADASARREAPAKAPAERCSPATAPLSGTDGLVGLPATGLRLGAPEGAGGAGTIWYSTRAVSRHTSVRYSHLAASSAPPASPPLPASTPAVGISAPSSRLAVVPPEIGRRRNARVLTSGASGDPAPPTPARAPSSPRSAPTRRPSPPPSAGTKRSATPSKGRRDAAAPARPPPRRSRSCG